MTKHRRLVAARTCTPHARMTGRRFHLGKNKDIFDIELFALYQTAEALDNRSEVDQDCTISRYRTCSVGH